MDRVSADSNDFEVSCLSARCGSLGADSKRVKVFVFMQIRDLVEVRILRDGVPAKPEARVGFGRAGSDQSEPRIAQRRY